MSNMKTLTFTIVATGLLAGGAFAKSHDQGQTETPGTDVFLETVGPAQTLGGARGNSANTPAAEKSNADPK